MTGAVIQYTLPAFFLENNSRVASRMRPGSREFMINSKGCHIDERTEGILVWHWAIITVVYFIFRLPLLSCSFANN